MRKTSLLLIVAALLGGMVFLSCGGIPPAETLGADRTTAKVYFFMPNAGVTITSGGLSFGSQFVLWDSDTFISNIKSKDCLVFNFKAGTHYFMAQGGNWYIVEAQLAAGKTYYFEVITLPGFRAPSVQLKNLAPNDPDVEKFLKETNVISPKGKVSSGYVKEAQRQLAAARGGSQTIDVVK